MAGRALAFADAEIVRMAQEEFIPVAADDWYQRRRQDAEGEFFRSVADQGPRKGEGGSTRQGIYCFTASGKLLAYKNAGQNVQVMREVLRDALDAWRRLPEGERRPGALHVPRVKEVDERYSRTLDAGGLRVTVYTRALERTAGGQLQTCSPGSGATDDARQGYAGLATALDHLWFTESDWRAMLPAEEVEGHSYPLADHLARRILRFHLVDNTRGEPPFWDPREIRSSSMMLHVERADEERIVLRLEGQALLATDADAERADRGYDAQLLGWIELDRAEDRIVRFDVAALGEHWGEGPYTRGARPGRAALAVVMELADGGAPADRVPPAAMRNPQEYLAGPAN